MALSGRLDETGIASLVTRHESGVDVLLAPSEPGTSEQVSSAVVGEVLQLLKRMYDAVVVDTPPAFSDQVLTAFDQTDDFLLLTTLDIAALKNLKLTLEMLDLLHYPRERWHVVVNRADARVGLSVADVHKTLGVPIAAEIPSTRAIPAASTGACRWCPTAPRTKPARRSKHWPAPSSHRRRRRRSRCPTPPGPGTVAGA